MTIHTTEITSATLASDNPLHQRLLFPYIEAKNYIYGNLLDVGCGEGRGVSKLIEKCDSYTGIDRNEFVIKKLRDQFDQLKFIQASIPPFKGIDDEQFNSVVSFQVIEHIENDELFVKEIFRVLKPGGIAIITTPNIKMSLTRNPWHVREYTKEQLNTLMLKYFDKVDLKGIYGNDKVMEYYEQNKKSVKRITRFDILNLQYHLPRSILQIPYDIMNRFNRNRLQKKNSSLVMDITTADYHIDNVTDACFDFFCIAEK